MSSIQGKGKSNGELSHLSSIGPGLTAALSREIAGLLHEKCADSSISKTMDTFGPLRAIADDLKTLTDCNTLILNVLGFLRKLDKAEVLTYKALPDLSEGFKSVRNNLLKLRSQLEHSSPLLDKLLDDTFTSIDGLSRCIEGITANIAGSIGQLPVWPGISTSHFAELEPHIKAVKENFLAYLNGCMPPPSDGPAKEVQTAKKSQKPAA